jgi:hypothetical protein
MCAMNGIQTIWPKKANLHIFQERHGAPPKSQQSGVQQVCVTR